jgi:hypothetical protein
MEDSEVTFKIRDEVELHLCEFGIIGRKVFHAVWLFYAGYIRT